MHAVVLLRELWAQQPGAEAAGNFSSKVQLKQLLSGDPSFETAQDAADPAGGVHVRLDVAHIKASLNR
jgi:hypothetical protein